MDGLALKFAFRESGPDPLGVGALFAEDFGAEHPAPDPEIIEPTYSAAELVEARETAWQDGHAAGLAEAAADHGAVLSGTMQDIATQLAAECQAAATRAEQSAEAIARLLFDCLAATFPALSAQYGDGEVQALIRIVLPGLIEETAISLRAHPRTIAALTAEIARLEPDLSERLQVIECNTMPPGDVRIAWHNGTATRNAAALWQQVTEILAPAGLLSTEAAIKEVVDGD